MAKISPDRKELITKMMANGTAQRPGLAFRDDGGCGLFRASADKIGLVTGGRAQGGIIIDDGKIGFNVASPTATFQIGAHSGTTPGYGTVISETATGGHRFYADDGGVAIGTATGSVPDVKNLQARTLITIDNSSFDARVHSIMGQLKSQNGEWGDEQWSAVHGYVELVRTAGTITLQSYGVTAGLMATVETAGNLGIAATHNLAGVAAISKLGYSGTFTDNTNTSGVYVGIYDSTNWSDSPSLDKWNHGLYVQAASVDKGFQIGELSSTAQTGLTLVATNGTSGADVFCDDGNVALTGGTPFKGFRSRTMFFKDQASGTTVMGVLGQLKYASGVDIGPARVAAVEGYNELMTTNKVASGGYVVGVSSVTEISAGAFTVESGGICAGFHAKLTGAGQAVQDSGGILAGLYINEDATTGSWGHGIYMNGAFSLSGIDMSTATFAVGSAILLGLFGTPVVYGTNELIELHGQLDAVDENKPMMRVRNSAYTGGAMTTGQVTAIQAQAYGTGTNNVGAIEAIQAHVGIKDDSTLIADVHGSMPNMRAGWFKIEDLDNNLTLTGDAAVMVLGMQWSASSTLTGVCDWVKLQKEGALTDPADAFIRVYDGSGGGWANFLLDVPASVPYSAPNSAGTQSGKIAINVGGNTKYLQCYSD